MAGRVIPQGSTKLPPAGDVRREVLAERQDALDEAAETQAVEVERADPKKLKIENEIAQHANEFNELAVSNADPTQRYCWTPTHQHGRFLKMKLAEGWVIVQGDDVEAIEHKGTAGDTTRRLGDTILLRIGFDRYKLLLRRRKATQLAREAGIASTLHEMGDRLRDRGVRIHEGDTMTPDMQRTIETRAGRVAVARAAGAQQFADSLRRGTVPGARA